MAAETRALTDTETQTLDAYWRAANYLSVGQIYLMANPLLAESLRPEHIKPRLLGHWGTSPGLNLPCKSAGLRWRAPPPEEEVRDRHDPGGIDQRYHRGPQPLGAPDLVRRPALDVDESRPLEDAVGHRRDDDQLAGTLAEVAPLALGCHDILRYMAGCGNRLHPTSPSRLGCSGGSGGGKKPMMASSAGQPGTIFPPHSRQAQWTVAPADRPLPS
jgi:hypothetical protein